MAASDWFCEVKFDSDVVFVAVVHQDYWERNKCLENNDISDQIQKEIPDFNLEEMMGSMFEFEGTVSNAKNYVTDLGMTLVDDGSLDCSA